VNIRQIIAISQSDYDLEFVWDLVLSE
jgi:hypothetical protein